MGQKEQQFIVEQRQVGGQCWVVNATSQAEAIRKIKEGEGEPVGFEITSTGAYKAWPVE